MDGHIYGWWDERTTKQEYHWRKGNKIAGEGKWERNKLKLKLGRK